MPLKFFKKQHHVTTHDIHPRDLPEGVEYVKPNDMHPVLHKGNPLISLQETIVLKSSRKILELFFSIRMLIDNTVRWSLWS